MTLPIQESEFVALEWLTEVGRRKRTVLPIDLANQVLYLLSQVLVGLEVVSARDCHLQKHYLANEAWVPFEESVKGMQFLRYSFDAVQAIDTQDNFCVAEIGSHIAESVLDTGLLEAVVELRGLNADGEGLDGYFSVAAKNAVIG